jgi:geranylgeranyl reductase family protein
VTAARYDALVVGAGPAGSVAALVLARAGARVALVDKARFPRDKACGDLVGPRGVQLLEELGVLPAGVRVGDMEVRGPTGRRVLLRAVAGRTYPGFGLAVPRRVLDCSLRQSALDAGADGVTGRAATPHLDADGQLDGFRVERGGAAALDVEADTIIGADGALSRVATVAGLVDERRVLWGFALRGYVESEPELPRIVFWEPSPWEGYPGYGWVFPGAAGTANIGLGVGLRGDRRSGARAARDLDGFVAAARPSGPPLTARLGGWLKMGMVGTDPARGRTLLVGDAAGLVNSLQGEGISQALGSGRAAAQAVLDVGPARAASRYKAELARRYAPYASTTAPLTAVMVGRPRLTASVGRLLTAPGIGRVVAGGWAVYWNDLLEGAAPGRRRQVAAVADLVARAVTAPLADRRSVWRSLGDAGVEGGGSGAGV